ncbi:transcription initiation factor bdp1 subunit [Malassezia pachydermatis]|uniref:Transcription initiation factor bdp1 subunit n=1 Tax=Malassezia pachydermatis TaxID=77020 RepID=A0A0M9VQ91_9BASI|nr:transcription initiation factor bdp1 subunit [Malassezia pachydermatis]KOS15285.1 transcription initiation factor bdp1 subunit [Malassezia pachydermatis]
MSRDARPGDFFFCIPIIFGCPNKIKQEGDGTPYVCPRCHNAQVVEAKSRTWFELCWIPLIPFSSKHIWLCGICQWQMPRGGGYQPQPAGMMKQ